MVIVYDRCKPNAPNGRNVKTQAGDPLSTCQVIITFDCGPLARNWSNHDFIYSYFKSL